MRQGAALDIQIFLAELARQGFTEGANLVLDRPAAELSETALVRAAQGLGERGVDVITTWCGSLGATAAKQATGRIPIVFDVAPDPVALGLVASLAKPGGNLTGFSSQAYDMAMKMLQYLSEVKPGMRRVVAVHHGSTVGLPWYADYRQSIEKTSHALGLSLRVASLGSEAELEPAFALIAREGPDAVFVIDGILTPAGFTRRCYELATRHRLPSLGSVDRRQSAALLGGASVTPGVAESKMAQVVVKILRGAWPADIPVEQFSPTGLAIDLRVARALGITIPASLLARAEEVIQ